MSSEDSVINFVAAVQKVQTLADGGLRLTLDLPESEIATATKMMQVKILGAVLEIAAVPVKQESTGNNGKIQEGRKRKSEWATAEEPGAN